MDYWPREHILLEILEDNKPTYDQEPGTQTDLVIISF